jgi:NAD(P)-dependent dehydrogenase (short-subunit alcohol dehydrogenase family)/acyl carrier protein
MAVLAASEPAAKAPVWFVTRGAVVVDGRQDDQPVTLPGAALWGLARTVAVEHPDLWGGLVDLPAEDHTNALEWLADRLGAMDGEDQVALRASGAFVPRLIRGRSPADAAPVVLDPEGVYLVTGGLGALGAQAARWLVRRGARHLLLAGRRGAATPEAAALVDSLSLDGASVEVVALDVTLAGQLEELAERVSRDGRSLRGVLHAAGVDLVAPLESATGANVAAVLGPKVHGGWTLHEVTRALPGIDLFVVFSSVSSLLGTAGRGHYAAANAFLDALAFERRRLGLPALTVNWGPWRGGGMASAASLEFLERVGQRGLIPEAALQSLEQAIAHDRTQVLIADIDWARFRPVYEARGRRPFVSELGQEIRASAESAGSRNGDLGDRPVGERPRGVPPIRQLVLREAGDVLGFVDARSVPTDRTFFEMGMDSLMTADFALRLERRLGLPCASLVAAFPDTESLSAELHRLTAQGRVSDGISSGLDDGWPALSVPAQSGSWLEELRDVPPTRQRDVLVMRLQGEIAGVLGFDRPEDVPVDALLPEMGFDSLMSAELGVVLERQLGVRRPGLAFEYRSVGKMADFLSGQLALMA